MDFKIFGKVTKFFDGENYGEAVECLDMVSELANEFKGAMAMGYAEGHNDGYDEGEEAGYQTAVDEYEADKTAEAEDNE